MATLCESLSVVSKFIKGDITCPWYRKFNFRRRPKLSHQNPSQGVYGTRH